MAASSDSLTTALTPRRSALRALWAALRRSLTEARQAVERTGRLIDGARLDHADD